MISIPMPRRTRARSAKSCRGGRLLRLPYEVSMPQRVACSNERRRALGPSSPFLLASICLPKVCLCFCLSRSDWLEGTVLTSHMMFLISDAL